MGNSGQALAKEHLVVRPVLLAALDRALDRRLTLIAAPAGAGKTTLLRQWEAAHPERVFTHLDVESADDDPPHFASRLLSALPTPPPDAPLAPIGVPTNGDELGPAILQSLPAALAEIPEAVIVLDDVDRFTNVTLVAELGRLIERMPQTAHIVLASRVDPPIALSRHRKNGDLLELRQAQLAFTEPESAALLELIVGRPLEPSDVRALREKTEGWAAGLQLAGLHLRNESDAESFIAKFNGSDRLVADYLGEEVLAALPPRRRQLLMEISILDDMCADLVEAATGAVGAQQILDELEQDCMFLVPLDPRRRWFRFHRLFSELLRSHLRAEDPEGEFRILTAAADWHLGEGHVKTALDYLLRAQAHTGAMEAILCSAPDGVSSESDGAGTPAPRRAWGFVAAQVLRRARPGISIEEARARLRRLSQNGRAAASSTELSEALVSGGRAYFLAGDTDEARRWLARALGASGSDPGGRVSALSALSLVEAWCRNTSQAEHLMREALETARDAGMLTHPAIADAQLASALTAARAHSPAPASERPTTGLAPGARHPLAAAQRPLAPVVPDEDEDPRQKLVPSVLFERAEAALTMGDARPARAIVGVWENLVPDPTPLSVVQFHILCARLAAVDDTPNEAIRELTAALKIAEIHGLVDVFVDAGPTILQHLSMISGPQAAFRDVVRARIEQPVTPIMTGLADPLTDRELELLAYLPTRYTNVELARRFFVSVNTIKTHMAHIYRKLDASTRDGAIERARELGLL